MSDKDQELEKMLSPFQKSALDSKQVDQWRLAVQKVPKTRKFFFLTLAPGFQLAMVLVVGVVIGGALFGNRSMSPTSFCGSPKVCKCST